MSDENKELRSADDASEAARKRAERIKAIKNSLRKQSEQTAEVVRVPENESAVEANHEIKPAAEAQSWDNELAERIAKRVNKVKSDKPDAAVSEKKSADSLLDELNSIINSNRKPLNKIHKEDREEISTPETYEENETEISENDLAEELEELPKKAIVPVSNEKLPEKLPKKAIVPVSHEKLPEELPTEKTSEDKSLSDEIEQKKTKKKPKKKKIRKPKKSFKEKMLGLLPNKDDSIGERIRKLVFLGSVFACIVFSVIIADHYIDIYTTESDYDDIRELYRSDVYVPSAPTDETYEGEIYTMLPNAKSLVDMNSDTVGFINIPNTQVSYPVVQSNDLEKYLNTSFTGEKAKAGAIFLDYRDSFDVVDEKGHLVRPNSENQIIYGHNMESGMMFGTLKNYKNNVHYYGEHPIIELNSNYKCYQYKIFAFFIIDAEDKTDTAFECWNKLFFTDEDDFYDYVNEAKRRTLRLNDVDVQYGDQLLTLSTCNSIFGNHGGGRLIIMARRVREGEDLLEGTQDSIPNPNIKWPSLYYKSNKNEKYDPDAEFVPYGPAKAQEDTGE